MITCRQNKKIHETKFQFCVEKNKFGNIIELEFKQNELIQDLEFEEYIMSPHYRCKCNSLCKERIY